MTAVVGSTKVDVEEFGRDIIVPDDPKARLMYYVDSIYNVLDMTSIPNIHKLRKYKEHTQLTDSETKELIEMCKILSPAALNNKVIFQDDSLCGHNDNKFFKINTLQHNLVVSEAIIVGGKRCSVKKLMAYKVPWIQWIYEGPMEHFTQSEILRDFRSEVYSGKIKSRNIIPLKNKCIFLNAEDRKISPKPFPILFTYEE